MNLSRFYKSATKSVKRLASKTSEYSSFLFNFFGIPFAVLITLLLINFTITQMQMATESPPGLNKKASDFILSLVGLTDIKKENYISISATLIGTLALLVAIWPSLMAIKKTIDHKKSSKKNSPIQKERIVIDGEDDLKIMLRHYKNATTVKVFSGDFSWIDLNADLKKEIMRLAIEEKITLISYKSEIQVRNAIKDKENYEKIKHLFQFNSKIEIKCSLVQQFDKSIFLYKTTDENDEIQICSLIEKNDSRYLLRAIKTLCESTPTQ